MTMLSILLAGALAAAPQDALEKRIDEILARLGADDIDARETAAKDLVALGPDALPLLRKRGEALEGEARGRVDDACKRIELERKRAAVLPPLRLVTLEARDMPAKELLETIARQAGLAVEFGGVAPETPVTLSLKDAPAFRALDEACRRIGDLSFEPSHDRGEDADEDDLPPQLAAEAAKGPRIVFQGGLGPEFPTAVVRHYRLRATQVSVTRTVDFRQNRSHAHVQLDLQWMPGVKPLALTRFTVESAVDDQGRSLLKDKPEGNAMAGRRFRRGHFGMRGSAYPHTLSIPVPPADAKTIALLKGSAVVTYPSESTVLRFETPAQDKGRSVDLKGLKVTLKDYRVAEGSLHLTIELVGRYGGAQAPAGAPEENAPFAYDDIQVISDAGRRLRSHGMSGVSDGTTTTWTLQYPLGAGDAVKEIRIPCVLARFEDEIAFELRDIPLPR
jgi:hypothetical protein